MKYFIILFLFGACQFKTERIVFSSSRDGNSNIYSMNTDGTDVKPITSDSTEEWAPTIMPSGEISFLRQTENTIIRIAIDPVSRVERYLAHPQNCLLDDKNILYNPLNNYQLYECSGEIYIADSIGAVRFQPTLQLKGKAYKAVWFPQGDRIAFTYAIDGQSDIYMSNLDGTKLKNITNSPTNEEAPDISPDGERLLFNSDREGNNNQEIYTMSLKGGDWLNISQSPDWELIGRWSKEGSHIYYGSNREGNWEIYKYEIATKKTTRITDSPSFDGDPRPLY